MGQSPTAGLPPPKQPGAAGLPERSSLMLAGVLLLAGFVGLMWIGITSADPNAYIRAVSGWKFFP